MKLHLNFCVFLTCLILIKSCYKEEMIYTNVSDDNFENTLILKLNNIDCSIDLFLKTLRYPIENTNSDFNPYIQFQEYSEIYFEERVLQNNKFNNLGKIEINKNYNLTIISNGDTTVWKLQFTDLPIVQIITHDEIINEPKTLAKLIIKYPSIESLSKESFIGIEHRGGASQFYSKKSYGLSFLNSTSIDDVVPKSIFNLPAKSQWILDAMYVDKARARNKIAFEIWASMSQKNNYSINGFFVELYLNETHQGLYCFNELMNAELIGLSSLESTLYKAINWEGTLFYYLSDEISNSKYWDGWEQKFPNENDLINWIPLFHLREVIVNYSDEEFITEIIKLINI